MTVYIQYCFVLASGVQCSAETIILIYTEIPLIFQVPTWHCA